MISNWEKNIRMTHRDIARVILTISILLGVQCTARAYDYGADPMRYLSNSRLRLGVDLSLGGAVTVLGDNTKQTQLPI